MTPSELFQCIEQQAALVYGTQGNVMAHKRELDSLLDRMSYELYQRFPQLKIWIVHRLQLGLCVMVTNLRGSHFTQIDGQKFDALLEMTPAAATKWLRNNRVVEAAPCSNT